MDAGGQKEQSSRIKPVICLRWLGVLALALSAHAWATDAASYRREAEKMMQGAKVKTQEAAGYDQKARDARSGKEKCPSGQKPEQLANMYETLARNARRDANDLVQKAEGYRRKADALEKAAEPSQP